MPNLRVGDSEYEVRQMAITFKQSLERSLSRELNIEELVWLLRAEGYRLPDDPPLCRLSPAEQLLAVFFAGIESALQKNEELLEDANEIPESVRTRVFREKLEYSRGQSSILLEVRNVFDSLCLQAGVSKERLFELAGGINHAPN